MKKYILGITLTAAFLSVAHVMAADNALVQVRTDNGRTVTIARVAENISAFMTVGREKVYMREIRTLRFHAAPAHTINSRGETFLTGGATVVLENGRTFQGTVAMQSNLTENPEVYARQHPEQLEAKTVETPTLALNGEEVPLSDIRSIQYLSEPRLRINWKGELYSLNRARITKRSGETFVATIRQGSEDLLQSGVDGLVVIPFNFGKTEIVVVRL